MQTRAASTSLISPAVVSEYRAIITSATCSVTSWPLLKHNHTLKLRRMQRENEEKNIQMKKRGEKKSTTL